MKHLKIPHVVFGLFCGVILLFLGAVSPASAGKMAYRYDAQGRLVNASMVAQNFSYTYEYDAAGNLKVLNRTACIDIDGDGYGSPGNAECPKGGQTDCDDNNASAIPVGAKDTDCDGIDDAWEIKYFGNLTRANGTTDYDGDLQTDLAEFENSTPPTTFNNCAASASQYTWKGKKNIEINTTGNATAPLVAIDASGNAIAVWAEPGGVFSNKYTAGSGWGTTPKQLATGGTNPKLVMDANGNALAVWISNNLLYASQCNLTTFTWSASPQLVSIDANNNNVKVFSYFRVAIGASGKAMVAYPGYVGTTYSAWGRTYNFSGAQWGSAKLVFPSINTNYVYSLQLAVADSGNAIVVCNIDTPPVNPGDISNKTIANSYNATSAQWGTAPTEFTGVSAYFDIAMDATGNAMLLTGLQSRRYDAKADNWGAAQQVYALPTGTKLASYYTNSPDPLPRIVSAANGDVMAIWCQYDELQNYSIWAKRYSITGATWGIPQRLADNIDDVHTSPKLGAILAGDTKGNVVVMWQERHIVNGTTTTTFRMKSYDAMTDAWGETQATEGYGSAGSIAMDARGDLVYVWSQLNGARYDVWANYAGSAGQSLDCDADGNPNTTDNCPSVANWEQLDTNNNGIGDACDPDIDSDGKPNDSDNCPDVANPTQADTDNDGIGNSCDSCQDIDKDGYGIPGHASCANGATADCNDNAAATHPGPGDTDCDGIDDAWELTYFPSLATANATTDFDKDGILDLLEFQGHTNPAVVDIDGDGIDDNWENVKFTNLTTADATSDYDKDGQSDLTEYLNKTEPKVYDCKIWGTAKPVESNDGETESPKVVRDQSGNAIAVWVQTDGTRKHIWFNRYTSSNGWGTAAQLESNTAGDADSPDIAMDAAGNAMVVWRQPDGIWHKRYTFALPNGLWGVAANLISVVGTTYYPPEIAMDTAGNAMAVWRQTAADGKTYIWAKRYTTTWGAATRIYDTRRSVSAVKVAMTANGNAIAVWRSYLLGTSNKIWFNRYVAGTGWNDREEEISQLANSDASTSAPEVAMDAAGNAIAVWEQSTVGKTHIWAGRNTTANNNWAKVDLLATDTVSNADSAKMAVDSAGNAMVVWRQSEGSLTHTWSRRYASGGSWGTAQSIETNTAGNADSPEIAMDTAGNAVAVWRQTDGSRQNIWANYYTVGSGWGVARFSETNSDGTLSSPQVALDNALNVMAVWQQSDSLRYNVMSDSFVTPLLGDCDRDTIGNSTDNCPDIKNIDQLDTDNDGIGNVGDPDDDNDGLTDAFENAHNLNPLLQDSNGDGITDDVEVQVVLSTSSLPDGTTGVAYSQTLAVTGGFPAYQWSITAGYLPTGLTLNTSTGQITGTPTITGTFNFMAQVRDAIATTATKQLSISVVAPPAVVIGDVNGDGVVDAGDVVLAQRIAMGLVAATSDQLSRGDVAPAGALDGKIDAADLVVIQRKAMGLTNF